SDGETRHPPSSQAHVPSRAPSKAPTTGYQKREWAIACSDGRDRKGTGRTVRKEMAAKKLCMSVVFSWAGLRLALAGVCETQAPPTKDGHSGYSGVLR